VRDLGSSPEHITQQHRFDGQHRSDVHDAICEQFTDKREFSNQHHYQHDNDHDQSASRFGQHPEFNRNSE
jgi:hypothetical protein